MDNWLSNMQSVCDTARFFSTCNVMDISFTDGTELEVYVAISPEERSQGLSEVSSIDLDGMLFVYQRPSYTPFTMAKMQMDLQIAWYAVDGSVIQSGSYPSGYPDPIYSPKPYSYVLEVPDGALPNSNLKVRTS